MTAAPRGAALPRRVLTAAGLAAALVLGACGFAGPSHSAADGSRDPQQAVPTAQFLDSIGVVTTWPDRGQPLERTVEMVRYGGFRWVRAGLEGLSDTGPTTIATFLELHRQTGAKLSWGLVSGGTDLNKLLATGRTLAKSDALLAFEGNNEPNNWGVTYQGETGGKQDSWLPVARLQRDLYAGVKDDPLLARYPVWSPSETGAQSDNAGLQFLTIPPGAGTMMPDGTRYADYANVHNYLYHPHSPHPADNKAWDAADPGSGSKVDGLYGNFGRTWGRWYSGYSEAQLASLPRVTTETGVTVGGEISEELHGRHLVNLYLAQFKRGYAHTAVYLLRDRTDEGGNQAFGFFRPDYAPRKAGVYLHNLTTILADKGRSKSPERLEYTIANQPETVHDLLLQRSDGAFQLVVWGERLTGEDRVTVRLGRSFAGIRIYDPTRGTAPVEKLAKAETLDLILGGHPLVIELPAIRRPGVAMAQ